MAGGWGRDCNIVERSAWRVPTVGPLTFKFDRRHGTILKSRGTFKG